MEAAPFRKQMRLKGYDYSKAGRSEILGHIVGGDAHIAPSICLSEFGKTLEKYINNIRMPNHIHMIHTLTNGAMWASPPTRIPSIVRSLKTLVTKECGNMLFQESFYDHIIRDEADYLTKWNYIDIKSCPMGR